MPESIVDKLLDFITEYGISFIAMVIILIVFWGFVSGHIVTVKGLTVIYEILEEFKKKSQEDGRNPPKNAPGDE